ncbi:MAG TPA: phage tail tube protein [Candidatus Sulfotelmatobacter sp.]|jgi:hypothetical protein
MTTKAYTGAGSSLQTSPDGVTYTPIAQVKMIKPSGAKLKTGDITNLSSPTTSGGVVVDEFIPTTMDPGTYDLTGITDPGNSTYFNLMTLQETATLEYFKLVLPDTSNFKFQGYLTDFTPADIDVSKPIEFTAKIKVSGPSTFTQAGTGLTVQE